MTKVLQNTWHWLRRLYAAVIRSGWTWSVLTLVVIAMIIGLPIYVWGWRPVWDWLSDNETNGATIRNVGLVLAGIVAFPIAIWRGVVAQRQAKAAEQDLQNERYQTGAELLGHATLSARLGGVYALQQLDSEFPDRYHIPVMRLFCAFARHPTSDASLDQQVVQRTQHTSYIGRELSLRADVQAVMEVIALRDRRSIEIEMADRNFRMSFHGANLHDLMLEDREMSDLGLIDANLTFATFSWTTFRNVEFWSCNLSFSRFASVDIEQTNWEHCNMEGAIFSNADLSNARLTECSLINANFKSANLTGVYFGGTDLAMVDFEDAELTGARFSHNGESSALNLRQSQLDRAFADPANPPNLDGVIDQGSGQPLVWRRDG